MDDVVSSSSLQFGSSQQLLVRIAPNSTGLYLHQGDNGGTWEALHFPSGQAREVPVQSQTKGISFQEKNEVQLSRAGTGESSWSWYLPL